MATKLHALPPQVTDLKSRGISSVIPLFDGKKPGYPGWQKASEEEIKGRFWSWKGDAPLNFGIRLGRDYGSLVDIDLDSGEARRLWKYFFPPSVAFGRGGNITHVLFKQVGRDLMDSRRYLWDKRDEKNVLLEVRFSGQTMGPGSVHPDTGEPIEWMGGGVDLAEIESGDLRRRAGMLAAASLLLRDWSAGWRDEVCVCLCGAMLRAGWGVAECDHFFGSIAGEAGDEEFDKRLKAERLAGELAGGGRVPGLRKMFELMGSGAGGADGLVEWLELRGGSLLEEMNERHALVMIGGGAYILDERGSGGGVMLKKDAFATLWANRRVQVRGRDVDAATFWLQSEGRREYTRGVGFYPEWNGVEAGGEEWKRRRYGDVWNLWRGWGVREGERGCGEMVEIGGVSVEVEWASWARHVYRQLCWSDDRIWRWVLGWFAHRVGRSWEVPGSALVMVGERGDGKGTIASLFGRLFGDGFMAVTHQNQLVGKFNSHLENKVLVFADEATWGGDKVGEGMLKTMITDERRVIERKGQEAYTVDNCCGYIIASNHDWVVPVGKMERRFFISRMRALDVRGAAREEYFDRIRDDLLGGGGLEVMLEGMRRLWRSREEWGSGFKAGGPAAGMGLSEVRWSVDGGGGELGREQWLRGAGGVEQWLAGWIGESESVRWLVSRERERERERERGGAGGGRFLIMSWAYQNYLNWSASRGVGAGRTECEVIFAKTLRKWLPLEHGGKRVRLSVEGRPWGVRLVDGVNLEKHFWNLTGT